MIPKIIHQIWLQGEKHIPSNIKKRQDSVKSKNPDWTYMLWDEPRILALISANKQWVKTYYSFNYLLQKVDYARYIIIYLFGGIYIDIDCWCLKPLTQFLTDFQQYDLIVSYINMPLLPNTLNNGVFIASPNNVVIHKMIESVEQHSTCNINIKSVCIHTTTGPFRFNQVISKYKHLCKTKILPFEYMEPCVFSECTITDNTYLVHDHTGDWLPSWVKHYKYIVYFLVVLFFFYIISKWFRPKLNKL
jgi:mannosyltransferase OCH1-like enzyme